MVIHIIIRTTIQRSQQQGTGLLRFQQRQDGAGKSFQLPPLFPIPQYRMSHQQDGGQLATHHIAIHLQLTVGTQGLFCQSPVGIRHTATGMVIP